MRPSQYTFELWTPDGLLVADLSGRTRDRRLTLTRNDTEDIDWRIDLAELKNYARKTSTTYQALIQDGITEVRIRKGEKYLCGGKITYSSKERSAIGDYLQVRARGFLDLLGDRLTAAPVMQYTNVDKAGILADLVNWTQGQGTDWDFGIRMGLVPAIGPYTIQLQNQKIKDVFQDFAKDVVSIDHQFTADKVLNLYPFLGTRRPDVVFTYPGNVTRLSGVKDATRIQNQLYVLGSGIGDSSTVTATVDRTTSAQVAAAQKDYKVREATVQFSAQLETGTVLDAGRSHFAAWGIPYSLPTFQYNGAAGPAITDYGIGDYVKFEETDDPDTDLNGFWRVEQIDLTLDDSDNEDIKVTVSR